MDGGNGKQQNQLRLKIFDKIQNVRSCIAYLAKILWSYKCVNPGVPLQWPLTVRFVPRSGGGRNFLFKHKVDFGCWGENYIFWPDIPTLIYRELKFVNIKLKSKLVNVNNWMYRSFQIVIYVIRFGSFFTAMCTWYNTNFIYQC